MNFEIIMKIRKKDPDHTENKDSTPDEDSGKRLNFNGQRYDSLSKNRSLARPTLQNFG